MNPKGSLWCIWEPIPGSRHVPDDSSYILKPSSFNIHRCLGLLKVVPSFQVFRLKFCEHFYEPTIWHASSPLLSRLSFPIFPEESWSVHILPLKGKRPSFTLVRLQVLAATNVMINRVFWGVPRSLLLPPPRPWVQSGDNIPEYTHICSNRSTFYFILSWDFVWEDNRFLSVCWPRANISLWSTLVSFRYTLEAVMLFARR